MRTIWNRFITENVIKPYYCSKLNKPIIITAQWKMWPKIITGVSGLYCRSLLENYTNMAGFIVVYHSSNWCDLSIVHLHPLSQPQLNAANQIRGIQLKVWVALSGKAFGILDRCKKVTQKSQTSFTHFECTERFWVCTVFQFMGNIFIWRC